MDCIFCKIVQNEAPAEVVYRDESVMAFRDIHPMAPVHILIIPLEHIESVRELKPEHEQLVGHMFLVARSIAESEGLDKRGYRLVVNTGGQAGQSVYHLHLHLLGGRPMRWPPG